MGGPAFMQVRSGWFSVRLYCGDREKYMPGVTLTGFTNGVDVAGEEEDWKRKEIIKDGVWGFSASGRQLRGSRV